MNSALTRKALTLAGLLAAAFSSLSAATVTWSGTTGSDWNTAGSWSGGAKPLSADTALFSSGSLTVANAVADQTVTNIQFGTASLGNITIGATNGNKLNLNTGGSISILNTVTAANSTETINAPLVLTPSSGTGNITYSFSNAATTTTVTMVVAGAVSGGTTTGTAALTLTGANAGTNTVSGLISDGGASGGLSVVKGSSGKWVLSNNANTFSGGISINSGTISTGSIGVTGQASALGTNGTIKVGSQGSTTLLYTGAGETSDKAFLLQGQNGMAFYSSGSGAVTLSGNISSTYTTGASSTNTLQLRGSGGTTAAPNVISGIISDAVSSAASAPLNLSKNDANAWALSGANSYSGTTTVASGTLFVGNGGTTGQLGSGSVTITGNLAFNRSNALTVANTLTGAGTLQQVGGGTTTLTGSNTFTGVTTITAGALSVATIGNGGVASSNLGSATNAATNLVFNGGALQYTGADASTDRNFTINTGKVATFDVTANNLTVAGNSTATTGGLTKIGSGTLTLSGTNLHTGVTTITAGTLSVATIGNGGASGNLGKATNAAANLVFNGGALQYTGATASTDRNFTINTGKTATFDVTANSLTVSGNSTASNGALAKIGAGTLILSGVNLYTGGTSVSAGTLRLSGNERLDNTGAISVSGGTLNLGGGTQTTSGAVTLSSGTIQNGTLTQNGGTFDLRNGTAAVHLAGTGALSKSTGDTVILSNSNSYSGATTVSGGTLQLGANGALPTGTALSLSFGAVLDLNGHAASVGRLEGAGGITLGSSSLTVDQGADTTFSGAISGTGGLAKSSAGKLILSGANTYSGATSVTDGTLIVNGSLDSAAGVTVSGGTLGGSGTIAGATFVDVGGILSPGNSPGLLTFSDDLTLGGTTLMEISGSSRGSTYDGINLGGTVTYGGTLHVTFAAAVTDGSIFGLFAGLDGTSSPVTSGSFSSVIFDGSGYDATLVYHAGLWRALNVDGHDFTFNEATGALSVSAVPEPSTYTLIAGAAALLGVLAYHRRTRAAKQI